MHNGKHILSNKLARIITLKDMTVRQPTASGKGSLPGIAQNDRWIGLGGGSWFRSLFAWLSFFCSSFLRFFSSLSLATSTGLPMVKVFVRVAIALLLIGSRTTRTTLFKRSAAVLRDIDLHGWCAAAVR